jgi:hypothetical protein
LQRAIVEVWSAQQVTLARLSEHDPTLSWRDLLAGAQLHGAQKQQAPAWRVRAAADVLRIADLYSVL